MATSTPTSSIPSEATDRLTDSSRTSHWDRWRRSLVTSAFRRTLRDAGGRLCEPGGLPVYGVHRVLVCRPNHRLGNALLLSPLIQEVEALYPGAEIDIVGSDAAVSLFADRFHVRRVFALPRRVARHVLFSAKILRNVRSGRYDLAIDACNGSQSGQLILALTRAKYKLGFPDEATSPASRWHSLAWPKHLAHRSVFLLRTAYAGRTDDRYPSLGIGLSAREKEEAAEVLRTLCRKSSFTPVLGIFTNATGAKRYSEAWWIQFLHVFQEQCPDVQVVDLVAAHGCSHLGERFVPFYTRNLRRMAAMIAGMDGFISADCGVMHLASASGAPTLGLFSSTDPAKYAPYGGMNDALDTRGMDATGAALASARWFNRARMARRSTQHHAPSKTGPKAGRSAT